MEGSGLENLFLSLWVFITISLHHVREKRHLSKTKICYDEDEKNKNKRTSRKNCTATENSCCFQGALD